MPRPTLPPTPASSTDIKGQDGSQQLSTLQVSFELPPPAMANDGGRMSPADIKPPPAVVSPESPNRPAYVQASETVKSRRRSSAAQSSAAKDNFALPPPPTRSRKIIQMKPRQLDEATESPATAKVPKVAIPPAPCATAKRKQAAATSAAGRKIARKTAHSIIERRRRSKMNEEFAVLKGMIPACTGEMHKLAILQASIEYVRYLEDCVDKLKAQQQNQAQAGLDLQPSSDRDDYVPDGQYPSTYAEDSSGDVEMTGSALPSPTNISHQPSMSPALLAEDSRHRQDSHSSVSTDRHRQYSYSASSTTSPAFGPQQYHGYGRGALSASGSTLTSPALLPQRDLDQEATAALLMLKDKDRRSSTNGQPARNAGRGMSVRDLLSA